MCPSRRCGAHILTTKMCAVRTQNRTAERTERGFARRPGRATNGSGAVSPQLDEVLAASDWKLKAAFDDALNREVLIQIFPAKSRSVEPKFDCGKLIIRCRLEDAEAVSGKSQQ